MLTWLIDGGIGPALVALPVNWAGQAGAGVAGRWFRRLRRSDDLSKLVRAAAGVSVELSRDQFDAVRRLLEDEGTWNLAGRGTVEDLVALIAGCLQEHAGDPTGNTRAVAVSIARGLLEFGVTDIDPELFQRLLFARLRRMETNQATRLDEVMLGLHADLAAWFAAAGKLDARQSREVMGQLRRVLDRLPPARAGRGEVAVYLNTLISWLSSDPWPRDQRFDGPTLDVAALERKLRVTVSGERGPEDLDADDLVGQCHRLVVLGGAGSGKTWLARRTARGSAEKALQAMAAGDSLDEVELPLYTTCWRLFSAGGDIRQAVVSSTFDQLADLGGSRLSIALREFFAERNAPTVLIIDSLDEASGSDDRLRQADTLRWRIILTSRPSSWNQQLKIEEKHDGGRVAQLQPLRYPADVETFIHGWFASDSGRASDLAAQIARRPSLQEAATVPLILAFYCIVGGNQLLPDFRRDLYPRVLRRMLTGRWRGTGTQPDVETCLRTLRTWAWSGATSDPVSGVGTWADDIPTGPPALGQAEREAIGHVATPLGLPDVDTGMIPRRFIHRSLREHLVAEHIATLPVDQAAKELLLHLWHDRDWEHSVPAAIAMHPQRDQLLRDLICCAAQSRQIPADLSAIDAGWQVREVLARIASESYQSDWSPEVAEMIGRARVELARSARTSDLSATADWATSNGQVRQVLLEFLTNRTRTWEAASLATTVAQLHPTPLDSHVTANVLLELLADHAGYQLGDKLVKPLTQLNLNADGKRKVRNALLMRMTAETKYWTACCLAGTLLQLDPTAEDTRRIRSVLLGLLASPTEPWDASHTFEWAVVARLTAAEAYPRETYRQLLGLLDHQGNARGAASLACALSWLDPTVDECHRARSTVLDLLDRQDNAQSAVSLVCELACLNPPAEERYRACSALLRLLDRQDNAQDAAALARELVLLNPGGEDSRQARSALLRLLDRQANGHHAAAVAHELVLLHPTAQDSLQARTALLRLLDRPAEANVDDREVNAAAAAARELMQLDPTAEDTHRACDRFLKLLLDLLVHRAVPYETIAEFVACTVGLAPTSADKGKALQKLLAGLWNLASHELVVTVATELRDLVVQLACTPEDRRQAQGVLLSIATGQHRLRRDRRLVEAIVQLASSPEEKHQTLTALLQLMHTETDTNWIRDLAWGIAQLACTPQDKRRALCLLLSSLTGQKLVHEIVQLAASPEDKRQARNVLLTQMTTETGAAWFPGLALGVAQLEPTAEDKRQARSMLLARMTTETSNHIASYLAVALAQLDPTAEDKRLGCSILTRLLAINADSERGTQFHPLFHGIKQLDPTVDGLSNWRTWREHPPITLLAAARRNSPLADWLAALPSYATLPDPEN